MSVVYAATLRSGPSVVAVVVHREESPSAGVPIADMNPGSEDYCGRPARMAGPFAGISKGRYGATYTGGWRSLDEAVDAIRLQAVLNNRDPRVGRAA